MGPGTIYLYAESKEALFDLAVRRSFEDPTVWNLRLPHPNPGRGVVADHVWSCLQNAAHFPRLWLAADSPSPGATRIGSEVEAIVAELYQWLDRYKQGVKLIERSAGDWPDVAQVFYRRFWRGGIRRVADYLARRMREGAIPAREDPMVAARFVVEALTWMAVHRPWSDDGPALTDQAVAATIQPMVASAILGTDGAQ